MAAGGGGGSPGGTLLWEAEGAYRPGDVIGMYLIWNHWAQEDLLLWRDDMGIWRIDDATLEAYRLPATLNEEATMWLQGLW